MNGDKAYFFCGIGGSGMLPLALILKRRGCRVDGSDRSFDQGRTPEKFAFLRAQGIGLHPQDGSGIRDPETVVVASAAIETTVPDVAAAKRIGARLVTRAELLAALFNASRRSVGIAGTSGKSTVTGMAGWILHACGLSPTVMNGAVMKNFVTDEAPFASALVGDGDVFVSEVDESDGSIARYDPTVAVLTNVSHDHKSMEDLRVLFGDFLARSKAAVVNLDNPESAALAPAGAMTFSLRDPVAGLFARDVEPRPDGIAFTACQGGEAVRLALKVPGRHNVANALAALAAARSLGVALPDAARALEGFAGVKRRLETVGSARGVTVIDDFAHNPDKIAATLAALHEFPGRLLILFQPHGYGPLKLMKAGFIDCFSDHLRADDLLTMPEPVYFGGTVDRSVSSADIVNGIVARGRAARLAETREAGGDALVAAARAGDRIVVMGARDDTLTQFAARLMEKIAKRDG